MDKHVQRVIAEVSAKLGLELVYALAEVERLQMQVAQLKKQLEETKE